MSGVLSRQTGCLCSEVFVALKGCLDRHGVQVISLYAGLAQSLSMCSVRMSTQLQEREQHEAMPGKLRRG